MKNLLIFLFLSLGARLLAVMPVPCTEGVSFSLRVSQVGGALVTVYHEPGLVQVAADSPTAGYVESSIGIAWLRPGRKYWVVLQASGTHEFWISYQAPSGYQMLVNDQPVATTYEWNSGGEYSRSYQIELRPVANYQPALLGSFSGMAVGKSISWDVGMGMLRSGRSAGRIMFKELDLANDPANRSRLYFSVAGNDGEIDVVRDGPATQYLRQVLVPQGLLDFVDDPEGGYRIHCYARSQVEASAGNPYLVQGAPWKTIRVQSPAANQLLITETEGAVSRVSKVSVESGSMASGTYTLLVQEGDGTAWLRSTTHTSVAK